MYVINHNFTEVIYELPMLHLFYLVANFVLVNREMGHGRLKVEMAV